MFTIGGNNYYLGPLNTQNNVNHNGDNKAVSQVNFNTEEQSLTATKKSVSQESINIHGLSYEFLIENGVEIHEIFSHLNGIFESYNITQIIAHNVDFDINILKSELYRYNYNITLGQIRAIPLYCTMKKAQKKMNVGKWPKLAEAYTHFYGDNITNAHDAEFDTLHCYKIYLKLME